MENNNDATRSSSATSGSLGILDLGNISDFNSSSSFIGGGAFEIKDKLSRLKENSQSNCSSTIGSNLVKENTFKIPDTSITNALLSKRIFPAVSNNNSSSASSLNNTKRDVLSEINEKTLSRKNESNTKHCSTGGISLLDSQYLRPCSDAEWRVSSTTENAFKNNQIISDLFGNRGAALPDQTISTEGIPTPSKGSRSIIGQNKLVDIIDNSFNFHHDQISARSSSLSGSGSSGGNPSSNTLKFGQSSSALTNETRNPFEVSNVPSFKPPNVIESDNFGFPNSFGNANVGSFAGEMFFSEDEAKNLLQRDEIEFQKEQLFQLPENVSVIGEDRDDSFGTFKNDLSAVTRPSFCSSSILGGEIPQKISKEILFKAKSDRLGHLSKSSNSQRPFFGLSVESPVRDNQTIQNQSELEDSVSRMGVKDHREYMEKLVKDLRVEETPFKTLYRDEINPDESSTSGFRCRSASEVDKKPPHHQRDEVRKFRSLENLSPTKKTPQYVEKFGSHPGFQQIASNNFSSFNPTPIYPPPCFQCCGKANYVTPPQMYYPLASHPSCHQMGVPFATHNPPSSYLTNEIIKGPEEIVDYVCLGSQAKIIIPLVNSSNQVLSCSFNLVTAFMGNSKAKSDRLGLVMPGNVEIPPRTAKDSTMSLLVSEEGVANIWIEIETSIPLLNTVTGSFTCYVKLVVEKPDIEVAICGERTNQSLIFNIQSSNRAVEKKLVKISNKGKATVPLIVFLQTTNTDDYRFVFPEQREIEETQNSRLSFKRLSPTILIFHSGNFPFNVPVTFVKNGNVLFNEYFEFRGTMTVGLQSTGKTEENLKEIPLLARRNSKLSGIIVKDECVSKLSSGSLSFSRNRNSLNQFTSTTNKSTNTTQIVQNEIPEKDTSSITTTVDPNLTTDSFLTTFNRPKWYLEPDSIVFDKLNEKRSFKICNASDNPMWFCVSEPSGSFNFSPPHGVSHKCSEVSVALKSESKVIKSEYRIKVTCDGFDKYVVAKVTGFT